MKLEPRDGALIVRGILPSLEKDGPPIARGLLIGLPSGFSFEYGTKPVRLLAVRRGEFVSRTDWEERGGKPLTPLGSVVFETAKPPFSEFVISEGSGEGGKMDPLIATLRSTSTKGGFAELVYDLVDSGGMVRAHVKERPRDVVVSDGAGIVQELEVTAPAPASIFYQLAVARDPKLAMSDFHHPMKAKSGDWALVHGSATSTIAVTFRLPEDGEFSQIPGNGPESAIYVSTKISAGPTPVTLKRIVIARGATTAAQLEKMTNEVKELR
jgi:hypothetical protein